MNTSQTTPLHTLSFSAFIALAVPKNKALSEAILCADFERMTKARPTIIGTNKDFVVLLVHSAHAKVADDYRRGITTLLHGDIYLDDQGPAPDAGALFLPVAENGTDQTARDLNGAYSALIITPDSIDIIVDRFGSRKIFYSQDSHGHWFTTTLTHQPRRKIDAAGVASLMINRCQYEGRTLYENVRTLELAHIHTLTGRGLASRRFWEHDFSRAHGGNFAARLNDKKREFNQLIKQAVRRRLPSHANILCSLSGGIDSRAVFGGLLECKDSWAGPLTVLSYGLDTDDDPVVAKELCSYAGLRQRTVRFQGEFRQGILENARHCEGLVYFYLHALSGIQQVAAGFSPEDVLFHGDKCFSSHKHPCQTIDEVLTNEVGIRSPAGVPEYYSYGATSHAAIQDVLQADIDSLKRRNAGALPWDDLIDKLFLELRLSNMLLPWREYLNGRYIKVTNPLLDNEVLEFMQSIPSDLRRNKQFFKEAVAASNSELFNHRYAKPGGNDMRILESLFLGEARELKQLIGSHDSDLDDVIPPDVIMSGLFDLVQRLQQKQIPGNGPLKKAILQISRKLTTVRIYFSGPVRGYKSGTRHGIMSLSPIQMATLLQVRYFLKA